MKSSSACTRNTNVSERIVYLEWVDQAAKQIAQELAPQELTLDFVQAPTEDEAVRVLNGTRVAIVATFPITDRLLRGATSLRFIQGSGGWVDDFDRPALRRRGIALALNPIGSWAVAEHTILLMRSRR